MEKAEGIAEYRIESGVAVLTIDFPPVNALSHMVRVALCEGVDRALADPGAEALVLLCAGRTFFAGADVKELGKPMQPPLLADVMARFESATVPIVSAIHGTALGGGLELALAGHYRVAVPSAAVGLPEVVLGLLPGAGGTQRTPRLIGVAAAVELIGLGRHVKAPEALALGLIDAIVSENALEAQAIAFARDLIDRRAPLRRLRDLSTDLDLDGARAVFARFRADHPHLFIGLKAAQGVLDAIEAAVTLPFDEGMERERALSRALVSSPESAAQRHLFLAERAAAKFPGAERLKVDRDVAVVSQGEDRDTHVAVLARTDDAGSVVTTRFLEELDTLAAALPRPDRLVGLRDIEGVAEVVVGGTTSPEAAVAAMAMVRHKGTAAIFVTPAAGGVVGRLRDRMARTIAMLIEDGIAEGDIAATGRAFGFEGALLPEGEGVADEALEWRLIRPSLAEALSIIDEGVCMRPSDIDYAAVRAGLWPLWKGGPAFMAERAGHEAVRAREDSIARAPV